MIVSECVYQLLFFFAGKGKVFFDFKEKYRLKLKNLLIYVFFCKNTEI